MKKIQYLVAASIVSLALATSAGCVLLNTIGLNPGHVSGAEAKDLILDKTLITGAYYLSLGSTTGALLVYLAPTLAGISDDKYYKRSEVQHCANQLFLFQFVSATFAPFLACNLEPDNAFIDP